jgi:transposase
VQGMVPSLAVEGATTAAVFETYVELVLSPMLRPGQIVVMDNLSSHKGERMKGQIEERGCKLLYLPPTRQTSIRSRRLLPRSRAS